MDISRLLKNPTDFTDYVGPISTKPEGHSRGSPRTLVVDRRPTAERTETLYLDMVLKIKEANDATNMWRTERDSMYFVQSPTNAPKRCDATGNMFWEMNWMENRQQEQLFKEIQVYVKTNVNKDSNIHTLNTIPSQFPSILNFINLL